MQISKTEVQDMMAKLTLVVEPADYSEQVEKEIRSIRQRANIPGFRPGKVPASLVRKMYGKSVLAEVLNKVLSEKMYEYIREEKLNILGEPLSNEEETPELDLDNQDTFTFVFDIALAPEFNCKLTGSNKVPLYEVTVTDEMVDRQVKAYAMRYGKMESRPEPTDDEKKPEEGEAAPEEGEKKEPTIIPAPIDQDLFDKVYGEGVVKSEQEFRDKVRENMKRTLDKDAEFRFGIDVKAAVMKKMEKVALPEAFLKRWLKTANKELTDEQIEKDWSATIDSLRWQLAKDQLVEQFGIKVESADVDNYAKEVARMQFAQYGMDIEDQYLEGYAAEMLKDEKYVQQFYERCREEKIYASLKEVVKIENKPISYDDFIKLS